MAEEHDNHMRNLHLMEEEIIRVAVEKEDINYGVEETIEELGLVGKRNINREPSLNILKTTMSKAWNLLQGFEIQKWDKQIYALQFYNVEDHKKVPDEMDYHHLFVFQAIDRGKDPDEMKLKFGSELRSYPDIRELLLWQEK
ncbi:unnamed protein product [Linum trigynum]|uniref:DUF4283 domain-containing protein n=1 Tax=Linum trigynum TaxID=586398 RepID=A0AAV2GPM5_9ROSI